MTIDDFDKKPKKSRIVSVWSIFLKIIKYFLWSIVTTGILFGMAFIVGVFIYIFTGNDVVLKFMADILTRIIDLRTYF